MGKKKVKEIQLERYSFSKLNTYYNCILNYIYSYILKQKQKENAMSQYGILIHSILDRWAKGQLEIYDLLAEYKANYDSAVTEPFPILRNGKSMGISYYADGESFFTNFNGIEEYRIVESEVKFEIQIEDFIFNGIIDLILKDKDGNIILWDWKSKADFKDEEEEKKYQKQLYLYSYYIKDKYRVFPSKIVFYCFRKLQKHEYIFNYDDFQKSIKWMFDTIKEIRKLNCKYDYFFCNNLCGSRDICLLKKVKESKENYEREISEE